MSQHYGQNITYGVLGAPALFTGDNMSFSYRDQVTAEDLEDGGSEIAALALHSRKGEINFSGEVTDGSDDFLDLSSGARITVSGSPGGISLSSGAILAFEAVEEWNLMRRKQCSVRAYHYPEMQSVGGASAGTLGAFTPSQSLDFLFPGNKLIYSTQGLSHASGLVHQAKITQQLTLTDDEPSPDGKILGAFSSGYKRTLSLLILATSGASIPQVRSEIQLVGADNHSYRVVSAEPRMERKKGMMFQIEGQWIPAF